MRTFWLSFCDPNKPKGKQFLGVSVVEVDDDDVEIARILGPVSGRLPGTEGLTAAVVKSHATGCNPGGEVGSVEIPQAALDHLKDTPRHTLMQKPELARLGHID